MIDNPHDPNTPDYNYHLLGLSMCILKDTAAMCSIGAFDDVSDLAERMFKNCGCDLVDLL